MRYIIRFMCGPPCFPHTLIHPCSTQLQKEREELSEKVEALEEERRGLQDTNEVLEAEIEELREEVEEDKNYIEELKDQVANHRLNSKMKEVGLYCACLFIHPPVCLSLSSRQCGSLLWFWSQSVS